MLLEHFTCSSMKKAALITVGRIKTVFWQKAAAHYRERLVRSGFRIEETVIKDADAELCAETKIATEGEKIMAALPSGYTNICLDARGQNLDSVNFAELLRQCEERARPPCFIIGGAYGLSGLVLEKTHQILSLGKMTFPHELAQIILWEQLFRADAIRRKTGYHHE